MATNHIYPFTTTEELKTVVSQIDINYQLKNITSSMLAAANDVKEYISEEMWNSLMAYFNTEVFEGEGNDVKKDQAFRLLRMAHGNFTLAHHMPFLTTKISSGGITTTKSDTETTAYKYQTDAIEAKLRSSAWAAVGELYSYLSKYATQDLFAEWLNSDQYTELKQLIFAGYRDFNKSFSIDNDAAFYFRSRHIITDKSDELLKSRLTFTNATDYEKKLAKKAVAFHSIAEAILQFDLGALPSPIRNTVANEHERTKGKIDFPKLKTSQANHFMLIGDSFLQTLDRELSKKEAITDEEKTEAFVPYEQELDADSNSVIMI